MMVLQDVTTTWEGLADNVVGAEALRPMRRDRRTVVLDPADTDAIMLWIAEYRIAAEPFFRCWLEDGRPCVHAIGLVFAEDRDAVMCQMSFSPLSNGETE